MGTLIGGGVIGFKKAVVLVSIFVFLGAVLQGHYVMKTIGKGIILSSVETYEKVNDEPPPPEFDSYFPNQKLPDLAIFTALISAAVTGKIDVRQEATL